MGDPRRGPLVYVLISTPTTQHFRGAGMPDLRDPHLPPGPPGGSRLESHPARHRVAIATQLYRPHLAFRYLPREVLEVWQCGALRVSGGSETSCPVRSIERTFDKATLTPEFEAYHQSPAFQGFYWLRTLSG